VSARPPRTAVLGLGLIGGSLAGALRARGWPVAGWDPDPAARRRAGTRGVATRFEGAGAASAGAEVVVLAAPPHANLELLERIALREGTAVVTDTGSVKREIAAHGKRLLGERFVPGHPMAGRTPGGAAQADPALFEGARWFLCGGGETARGRVARMVRAVGARPVQAPPARHDRMMARVSHLPQILASLLVGELAARDPEALAAAGPGFRGWARLAASPPELWMEILAANAGPVRDEIARLERALADLRTRWERADNAPLRVLARGRRGHALLNDEPGRRPRS
jgi:prephenate dehydrogenase